MTTSTATRDSEALRRYESTLGRAYRKVFNDRPELSIRVRVLFALTTLWATATLWVLGLSSVVPLATVPALAVGHFVAYKAIMKRMPWVSMMIAGVIITAGVMMRFDLVEALQGNRIPVANFLLIAGSAAVFDARTRAGLYTQLIFSGIVMFFASEKAFGNEFVGLLGGYMALLVVLFATIQWVDVSRDSKVKSIGGRFASVLYWGSASVAIGLASVAAFMILPWDTSQTPQAARMAFLPVTGEDSPLPNIDPATAKDMLGENGESATEQLNVSPDLFGDMSDGQAIAGGGLLGEYSDVPAEIYGTPLMGELGGEDKVAYVRSSVASYWRGETFDTFDAEGNSGLGQWYSTRTDDRRTGSIFSQSADATESDRYLQTYFVQHDLGQEILTGYEPLAIAVPRDNRGRLLLKPGSTYQVVSKQPETDPDILRRDRAGWIAREYGMLNNVPEELKNLTQALVADAENDFDKASAITSYLQNLEYDERAESPLQPTTDMLRFIIGELPGSSIDFATALTMMARQAGLQSRIATGYLPGEYNSYSGASKVTPQDAHAWSEIYFNHAGWIPFDASTRPDLPTPSNIEQAPPGGLSSLLDRRFGDSLAAAAGKTPGFILKGFEFAMNNGVSWGLGVLSLVGFGSMLVWFLYLRPRTSASSVAGFDYDKVVGDDRLSAIKTFKRVEKYLAKNGFRKRLLNESYREYANAAQITFGSSLEAFQDLADAASQAAFSSQLGESSAIDEAESSLKASVAS